MLVEVIGENLKFYDLYFRQQQVLTTIYLKLFDEKSLIFV